MKVRMMLPMSVRCNTCGNFMYKGTKFNTRMENVKGENYLGIKIFRFYYKCTNCSAEFCMKTDPKSADYIVEAGATRNYELWKDQQQAEQSAVQKREEEEKGNAIKELENRTLDSKREMEMLDALDEMRSMKARHEAVTTEAALAALKEAVARDAAAGYIDEEAEDEEAVRQMLLQRAGFVKRLPSSEEGSESDREGSSGVVASFRPIEGSNRVEDRSMDGASSQAGGVDHPVPGSERFDPGRGVWSSTRTIRQGKRSREDLATMSSAIPSFNTTIDQQKIKDKKVKMTSVAVAALQEENEEDFGERTTERQRKDHAVDGATGDDDIVSARRPEKSKDVDASVVTDGRGGLGPSRSSDRTWKPLQPDPLPKFNTTTQKPLITKVRVVRRRREDQSCKVQDDRKEEDSGGLLNLAAYGSDDD